MCGIVGYMGPRAACPILIKGLKRLEYRGYDSVGLALNESIGFHLFKTKGKVADFESKITHTYTTGTGIAHTRWATHGLPNDTNAHPHLSESGELVLIHNGIIENFLSIKSMLLRKGVSFQSETDTEVLINLIEYIKNQDDLSLEEAVRLSLNEVVGAYAIVVMERGRPDKMIAARLGSPLTIGIGDGEFFLASDASPFIEYTKNALYLEDGEMGVIIKGKEVEIRKITNNDRVVPSIQELRMNLEEIEKGGYEHFMLKEIYEQPRSILDTMRGRLLVDESIIWMAGIWDYKERFIKAKRITIVGCGTSWHAALIGEYLLEELAQIPVEVEYSSEFRYRNPIIYKDDIVIAVSQSGETADTLSAVKLAKEKGAFIFGICNVAGSSIARITDAGAYTHAGPEIGVASTKAFTAQVTVLSLIALKIGKHKGVLNVPRYRLLCNMLNLIPDKMKEILEMSQKIELIAREYKEAKNFLYLGRGLNFPVALEGALKLKEISYIHAEGYPAAEMKHGPIALIDENMPVVVIAPKRGYYEKIVSNIQEIKARKARIIAIVNQGDEQVNNLSDHIIEIPDIDEMFTPLIATIPLQLLAYYIAIMRGENVDQPRNLAKSVTVE
ncbi:glutamine--fructose-6-phosphate transaminase (isomerizing) [Bacteroidetes bacterium endosymbiont of Geopemphigus sp.]|uniref:glutamine--fructose-6-phosphate transaminase (isomerizing) n=1 Tax=Bacteroidetes bacterium endosymbiont of Geopemphigus sp. TaxID=2047937 RepID=UPI000CD17DB0|nr:glutamine--fructose-6-phosphate transaminase (isomerizing) [Bacteroidetes bacterium endosymbiont of Geopemphigus sp.]